MHPARLAGAILLCPLFAFVSPIAQADDPPPLLSSVSAGGLARLRADIDGGGDFSVNGGSARVKLGRAFGPSWVGDVTVAYGYEDWRFGTPGAFGRVAPWSSINEPSVSFGLRYRHSERLTLMAAPQVEWDYESGASASGGASYGAALAAIYGYSPSLTLGLGAGVFRQVNRTQVLPFVLVNWQIDDKWSLSNPLDAGPTGGPGLELTYSLNDAWDLGIGAAFRDTRFRLKRDGPTPNGIGQDSGVPIFAHLQFTPSRAVTLDFYAGAIVNGQLRVIDSNGATVSKSDYDAQPVLGIRAAYAF